MCNVQKNEKNSDCRALFLFQSGQEEINGYCFPDKINDISFNENNLSNRNESIKRLKMG